MGNSATHGAASPYPMRSGGRVQVNNIEGPSRDRIEKLPLDERFPFRQIGHWELVIGHSVRETPRWS